MQAIILAVLAILLSLILLNTEPYRSETKAASSLETFDIYLINLSRDKKRLQHFMRLFYLSDLASFSFTRIDAVDGSKLDVQGLTTTKAYNEIKEAEIRGHRVKHYQLTRGAVGCYVSHLNALKAIQRSGKDFGVVFEDDVVIKSHIFADIQTVLQAVPRDWDIILLGFYCLKCDKSKTYNVVHRFFGLQAYLINQKGIGKVLATSEAPYKHQLDHEFSNLAEAGKLNIYSTPQSIAHQATNIFNTNIQIPLKRKEGVDPFANS